MGEFDDVKPKDLGEATDRKRASLQREQAETDLRGREEADRHAADRAARLADAERRTAELFKFLDDAFRGHRISIKQNLVVERTGSRPDGVGKSRVDEKPSWIVIRAAGTSLNARHKPRESAATPEYVLAARCGVNIKYELLVYPIERQHHPDRFLTDDRDAFLTRIQDEIATR